MRRSVIVVSLIIIALAALHPSARAQDPIGPAPDATREPLPTYTPYPTYTPAPTYTPFPEATKLSIAPPPAAPAPRPVPGFSADTMAAIDRQLNDLQLQLERLQSARLARNAPLLQLPTTHAAPVDLDREPRGQAPDLRRRVGIDSWYSAAVEAPELLLATVRVDVYQGPAGWGYVIVAETVHNGQRWIREINIGGESWREHDWTALSS